MSHIHVLSNCQIWERCVGSEILHHTCSLTVSLSLRKETRNILEIYRLSSEHQKVYKFQKTKHLYVEILTAKVKSKMYTLVSSIRNSSQKPIFGTTKSKYQLSLLFINFEQFLAKIEQSSMQQKPKCWKHQFLVKYQIQRYFG